MCVCANEREKGLQKRQQINDDEKGRVSTNVRGPKSKSRVGV